VSGYFASFSRRSGPIGDRGLVRPAPVAGPLEVVAPAPRSEVPVESARPTVTNAPLTVPERVSEEPQVEVTMSPAALPEMASRIAERLPPAVEPMPVRDEVVDMRPTEVVEPRLHVQHEPAVPDRRRTQVPAATHQPQVEIRTVDRIIAGVDATPLAPQPNTVQVLGKQHPAVAAPQHVPKKVGDAPPAAVPESKKAPAAEKPAVDVKIGSISIEVRAPRREPERRPIVQAPRPAPKQPAPLRLSRLYWRGW
jgi:hypothetical protein